MTENEKTNQSDVKQTTEQKQEEFNGKTVSNKNSNSLGPDLRWEELP